MDKQRAIEILSKVPIPDNYTSEQVKEIYEAFDVILSTVNMQIPRGFELRQTRVNGAVFGVNHHVCPTCGYKWNNVGCVSKVCPECGQLLKRYKQIEVKLEVQDEEHD